MEIRLRVLGRSARADCADHCTFRDGLTAPRVDRAEMSERDGIAVGGLDRHALAAYGNRPGKRDGSGRGRTNCLSRRGADVDATVLAGGVRVVAEREALHDRPLNRPCPCVGGGRGHEQQPEGNDDESAHPTLLVVQIDNESTVEMARLVVKMDYRDMS
jgi:hypothetical protein